MDFETAHFLKWRAPSGETTKFALTQAELEAEANKAEEPTLAQQETGNYRKGHVTWKGLEIAIETPAGRHRKDKHGNPYPTPLRDHYGYFNGYVGADGDHVDVFVSADSDLRAELVFVVNQVKQDGSFDEHKCLVGYVDEESARAGYLANYQKGWTGLGSIKAMTLPDFKKWLEEGDMKKQASEAVGDVSAASCLEPGPEGEQRQGLGQSARLPKSRGECPHCGSTRTNGMRTDGRANAACGDCGKLFTAKTEQKTASHRMVVVKRASDDEDDEERPFIVAVDLDGTLAEKEEPFSLDSIGPLRDGMKEWLDEFDDKGAYIVIHTVRGDKNQVAEWLEENEIPWDNINENPWQPEGSSDKLYADVYLDDRAVSAEDPEEAGQEILRRMSRFSAAPDAQAPATIRKIEITIVELPAFPESHA